MTHLGTPDHERHMSSTSLSGDFADSLDIDLLDTVRNAPSSAVGRVPRAARPWAQAQMDPHGPLTEQETFDLVFDVNLASRYGSLKKSAEQRSAAVEFALRRCINDPAHAEALIAMWRTGAISVSASTVGADKNGIFENRSGDCLRGYDADTSRQLLGISIGIRGWIDADGTDFRAASVTED